MDGLKGATPENKQGISRGYQIVLTYTLYSKDLPNFIAWLVTCHACYKYTFPVCDEIKLFAIEGREPQQAGKSNSISPMRQWNDESL